MSNLSQKKGYKSHLVKKAAVALTVFTMASAGVVAIDSAHSEDAYAATALKKTSVKKFGNLKKGYTVYTGITLTKKAGTTDAHTAKTLYVQYSFQKNGKTYYRVLQNKKHFGVVEAAAFKQAGNGLNYFGAKNVISNRQVQITAKDSIYSNLNSFKVAGSTEDHIGEMTVSNGYFNHYNGQRYYALYQDGKLFGYVNTKALKANATDLTDLNAAIKAADELKAEDYTKASFEAFAKVLDEAKATAKKVGVNKADADAAVKALDDATKALVKEAKVNSVEVVNGTTVKVTFNVAVNKTEAETLANVTIGSQSFATRTLSEDGKVLTLVSSAAITLTNATVVVEPITTEADPLVKTAKYVSTLTYKDEVAPTIVSVESKTNGTVAKTATITMSEPVTAALVKVNGAYVTATPSSDKLNLSGLNLEVGKTHTVEVINATDAAGNKIVTQSTTFTVAVDAALPTATLSASGDKQILVTFNKPMNTTKTIAALANGVVKDEALASITSGTATEVAGSNGTQFLIPITSTLYTNKDTRTLSVVLTDSIEDTLGNKLTAAVQTVNLVKDTAKPVATGYKVVKNANGEVTSIEVNFNEGLAAGAAVATPVIVSENGVLVNNFLGGLTGSPVTAGDKKVVYTATTPAKMTGKYAFSFAAALVSDQAETPNKSEAFNYTIDFGQSTTESTFKVSSASGAANVLTVTFAEAVKGGAVANSATDLSNYTLASKPLPAGTTIVLDATQKIATITLPAESVATTDATAVLTVANVKSTVGDKTVTPFVGTVAIVDNVKPVLTEAKVLSKSTIELTYSEAIATLTAEDVAAAYEIKIDGVVYTGNLTANSVSGFDKKVLLTLDADSIDVSLPVTVETKDAATVKDTATVGNTQKAGTKVTATK